MCKPNKAKLRETRSLYYSQSGLGKVLRYPFGEITVFRVLLVSLIITMIYF